MAGWHAAASRPVIQHRWGGQPFWPLAVVAAALLAIVVLEGAGSA